MRKLICGGGVALFLGGISLYLLPSAPRPTMVSLAVAPLEAPEIELRQMPRGPDDFDLLSEPLVVEQPDGGVATGVALVDEPIHEAQEALTCRTLVFGRGVSITDQAPRPEEEKRRMPYADEETQPVSAVAETSEPEEVKEGAEVPVSVETPDAAPLVPAIMDYHHQYPSCPYTGRCPAPYPQR
jgi:hypothetical protein